MTSSALVGSSAISSGGPAAIAIAISTRCRIPPDSSCGYCRATHRRVGQPGPAEQLDRVQGGPAAIGQPVDPQHLGDLGADPQHRVEGQPGVLRDQADPPAPDRPQPGLRQRGQVERRAGVEAELDPAGLHPAAGRQQPDHGVGGVVLPEPDSPTSATTSPGCDVQVEPAVHGACRPGTDTRSPRIRSSGSPVRSLIRSLPYRSSRARAIRFTDSTVAATVSPGRVLSHQAVAR